jgi:hypothetical protein
VTNTTTDTETWNDGRLAELGRLFKLGLSMRKIGLAIGVSKNTIVGKVRRLRGRNPIWPLVAGDLAERLQHTPEPLAPHAAKSTMLSVSATSGPMKASGQNGFSRSRVRGCEVATVALKSVVPGRTPDQQIWEPTQTPKTLLALQRGECRWPVESSDQGHLFLRK